MRVRDVHGFLGETRRILFGIFVTGLLAGFGSLVLRPHEPVYQGKPLSLWFQRSYPHGFNDLTLPSPQVETAVSAVGSEAVPLLLRMVAGGESIRRRILVALAHEYPFLHLPMQMGEGEIAVWAFQVLGTRGKPAVSELVRLLEGSDRSVRVYAARSLAGIGPIAHEAVPALIAAMGQATGPQWQDVALRSTAAAALGEMGTAALPAIPYLSALTNVPAAELALIKLKGDSVLPFIARLKDTSNPTQWTRTAHAIATLGADADPAVPLLLSGLHSTNQTMVQQALYAVARLQRRPDLCVPALAAMLECPDPNVRYQSLLALGAFGAEAKPAVPQILRLIQHSTQWQWVQWEATNALTAIDPEAAAKVVLKPTP